MHDSQTLCTRISLEALCTIYLFTAGNVSSEAGNVLSGESMVSDQTNRTGKCETPVLFANSSRASWNLL